MALIRVAGRRSITMLWLLVFLCLLLCLTWLLGWTDATHKVDRLLHDSWVRVHQRPAPPELVIAAIDSDSVQSLGRWPWPRDLQALLFDQLWRSGAKVVVVDLIYTEESANSADDSQLAAAIEKLPLTVLPVLTEGRTDTAAVERLPLPDLTRAVTDLGHIFLPIDDDGIVRRVHLKSGFNRPHWSTLSLAALQSIHTDGRFSDENLPGRRLQDTDVLYQWVADNEILIPFYGPSGRFPRISAADIIRGDVNDGELRDKIVFVGMTATGLGDVVPTPVSALDQPVPGIEIHANIFASLSDGSLVTRISKHSNLLVALFLMPFMLLVYSRAPPQWSLVGAIAGSMLPILLSFLLYRYARLWYAPLTASLPVLISYLFWSRHRLDFVNRFIEREQAKLEPHLPQHDSRNNELLAEFFENAARHLPIDGWRFSARDEIFGGGSGLPDYRVEGAEDGWRHHGHVYAKQFATPGRLHIELSIPDSRVGQEVIRYVDTLARVTSRQSSSVFSGSIERLQNNARRLSVQMDWMRNVKVFTETILAGSPVGFVVWNAAGEQVRGNTLLTDMVPDHSSDKLLVDFCKKHWASTLPWLTMKLALTI